LIKTQRDSAEDWGDEGAGVILASRSGSDCFKISVTFVFQKIREQQH